MVDSLCIFLATPFLIILSSYLSKKKSACLYLAFLKYKTPVLCDHACPEMPFFSLSFPGHIFMKNTEYQGTKAVNRLSDHKLPK